MAEMIHIVSIRPFNSIIIIESFPDEDEITLTPTISNFHNVLASRRLSNSSESDNGILRQGVLLPGADRFRHLSGNSIRRVPKSASTSSIPESRLIIPNDSSPDFSRNRSIVSFPINSNYSLFFVDIWSDILKI